MVLSWDNSVNRYRHHRLRVCNAKSIIDHRFGNEFNKDIFMKRTKIREDYLRFQDIAREQFNFFTKMNALMRLSSGHEDLITSASSLNNFQMRSRQDSRIRDVNKNLQKLEKENDWLGRRILSAKSLSQSASPMNYEEKAEKHQSCSFQVPVDILSKYENLNVKIPEDKETLRRLLRPKIFLDLGIHGIRRLQRFVIELFTEACPQVVLELVRACKNQNAAALQVIRIFPGLWLESELKLKDNKLNTPRIEYDMRAMDHSESGGVLSFAKSNLKGFRFGVMNFSISFKPLSVLNGERVGFGRLLVGKRDHNILQEYGTKNGKMTKVIKVLGCGLL